MLYQNYYNIEVLANGSEIQILPSEFSFILTDSIHSLYNGATIKFHDFGGLLQEYYGTLENFPIQITLGNKDNSFTGNYIINKDYISDFSLPGILSGYVNIPLYPQWYANQTIKSKAYTDSISNIAHTLLGNQSFTSLDIETINSASTWYQPLMTDAMFIRDILLPNCYNDGARNTPFFAYITSDYVFHLKSYNTMVNPSSSGSLATLYYKSQITNNTSINLISQLKRWRVGLEKHQRQKNKFIFSESDSSGSLNFAEQTIDQYPGGTNTKVPIFGTNTLKTDFFDVGYDRTGPSGTIGNRQSKQGRTARNSLDSLFMDEFEIVTPLNPTLFSGSLIVLNLNYMTNDPNLGQLSKNFSGPYLIESANHVWDGVNQKGYSKFIIGRKYVNVPSTYLLGQQMIGA